MPTPVMTPKESGGVKRPRHERTHVAHESVPQLCREERTTLTSSQTATVDRKGWSVTTRHCRVACATRVSWRILVNTIEVENQKNGGNREGRERCPDENLPGNAVRMGTFGRVERSPKESHATIGATERANRTVGEVLRTLNHVTEMRVGGRRETDQLLCMVPHCCWIIAVLA